MPLDPCFASLRISELETDCTGLILAVSGGPDSMAMLSWYASRSLSFPLMVAHVHHGLREESDEEEVLVSEYCKALKIPFRIFRTNVKKSLKKGETVESAARRLRYSFFCSLAKETGASHIATAHTKDDQCETILLHLIHGAGPKGLCGILPKRKEQDVTLIRPLLGCTKEELLRYCDQHAIPYAMDSSNQDLSYTRNRIRHEILPSMEQINPKLKDALCRTALAMQKQQQAFELRAEAFLTQWGDCLPANELRTLPEGEQAEILRQYFGKKGKQLSAEQVAQGLSLLKKNTGTVEFDRHYLLHLGQNRLTLSEPLPPVSAIPVTGETTILEDGRVLTLSKTVATEENRKNLIPICLPLILRTRAQGDTIRTEGGTKTLKKRMIEKKIPMEVRDRLRILTDGTKVLWCEGLGSNPETLPKPGEDGYFVSLSEE